MLTVCAKSSGCLQKAFCYLYAPGFPLYLNFGCGDEIHLHQPILYYSGPMSRQKAPPIVHQQHYYSSIYPPILITQFVRLRFSHYNRVNHKLKILKDNNY